MFPGLEHGGVASVAALLSWATAAWIREAPCRPGEV